MSDPAHRRDLYRVREAKLRELFETPDGGASRSQAIALFVAALDDEDTDIANEAQFGIVDRYGAEALDALLEAAPKFKRFGQLCAIEVFTAIGDPRAQAVVVPWLESDDDVVRAWSAELLGTLHSVEAIPALSRAWQRTKAVRIPPDESEPTALRRALAKLGARDDITPAVVADLASTDDSLGRFFAAEHLGKILGALYAASQVVPYAQCWTRRHELNPDGWYRDGDLSRSASLDWTAPWSDLVEDSRRQITPLISATRAVNTPLAFTIEWIDQADR